EDARELKEQVPKYWDGATPLPGLTLAETQRFYILSGRESNAAEAAVADIGARARAAGISGYSVAFGLNDTSSLLGPDALEFALLVQKREDARQQAAAETYDRYGPVLVHLPAPYVDANAQAAMAPYPGALWARTVRPEDGGIDMVITAHPGPTRPLSLEIAANPPPLAVRITRRVNGQDSTDPVAIPTWTELAQKE
ncbi:MAG: hypothetical protein JWM33_1854, partial [Caulobacteraceae bacterium]|nr:hypothetical protein [Caulobacteraceae bacterium]